MFGSFVAFDELSPRGEGAHPRAARTHSSPRRHAQIREIPLRPHADPQADAPGRRRALGGREREFVLPVDRHEHARAVDMEPQRDPFVVGDVAPLS